MNKSKKLTATVAASAVASALVAPAAFAGTNFSDIDGSFAKDAIMQLADAGIINGVGDGKFNPSGLIERQDFAIVLAKALKLDTSSAPATATFSDIPTDHYAFAAVEACVKAGLIAGQGNGTFGAGAYLTRQDMAVFFGRALNLVAGKDVVSGQASKLNFSDAASISDYAKDAVGAAFDLGYISGSNGMFDPTGTATREQVASLATRWMKAADTVANSVFAGATYTDANTLTLNFSEEVSDIKAGDVMVAAKADGQSVNVTAVTLSDDKKSATVKTDALMGATTYAVTYAGKTFEVTTPDKIDASVAATGAKKVAVTFNSAVDTTKATFTVTKGSITANIADVAWDDAKKVATLTLSSNLTAGDYTVAVNGLANAISQTFTAEDQKVAKIDLNDNAVLTHNSVMTATVGYVVYNQYNEDVTNSIGGNVQFTVANGTGVANNATEMMTVTAPTASGYQIGDKISVSAIDPATGTFASKAVTVAASSSVSQISISKLYNADGNTLDANSTANEYELVIDAKDQYGNAVSPADLANDLLVTVSDKSILDVDGGATPNFTTDTVDGTSGVLVLKLADGNQAKLNAGTAKITFVSRTTGQMASYDVTVKETSAVDTISFSAPDLAVAGETVNIPYSAVDQFGNETTDNSVLQNVTVTSSVGSIQFVPNYVTGKAELQLTLPAGTSAGSAVISAITPKAHSAFLNVAYQPSAVASVVSGLSSVATNFVANGTSTIDRSHVVILDQYGRTMSSATFGTSPGQYQLRVESSDTSKVSGVGTIDGTTTSVTLTGVAKGSSTYTLTLLDNTGNAIADSGYTFTAKTVDQADISSYELADFGKLYSNTGATGTPAGYEQAVTVNGVLANGNKVAIPKSDLNVTVNTTGVTYDSGNNWITADQTVVLDSTTLEATVPVVVTVLGATSPTSLIKNVVVSSVAPAATTLTMTKNDTTGFNTIGTYEGDGVVSAALASLGDTNALKALLNDVFETVDQYGVDVTPTWTTVVASNFSNTTNPDLAHLAAGDTFNITGVTSNSKIVTIKVIVK